MRRLALGCFSFLFLVAAAVQLYRDGIASAESSMMASICLRVGLVLGATWLAYPQLRQVGQRVPPWFLGTVFLALIFVLIKPRAILAIAPILAAIAVLQYLAQLFKPPGPRNRPSSSQRTAERGKK